MDKLRLHYSPDHFGVSEEQSTGVGLRALAHKGGRNGVTAINTYLRVDSSTRGSGDVKFFFVTAFLLQHQTLKEGVGAFM